VKWKKLGKIFDPTKFELPDGCAEFAQSPQALVFDDFVRIYFSTRSVDKANGKYLSHVAFVDMNEALRDWVRHGARSRYALSADQLVARSQPRDESHARAAACFELAQHLHRGGLRDDAVRWFREAHRLAPENWTYRRQAWSLADPLQGPTQAYDSDWLTDVRRIGAENYYPPLQL